MSTDDASYAPKSPDLSSFYPPDAVEPPAVELYDPQGFPAPQFGLQSPSSAFGSSYIPPGGIQQQGYTPPTNDFRAPSDFDFPTTQVFDGGVLDPVSADPYPPINFDLVEDLAATPEAFELAMDDPTAPPAKRKGGRKKKVVPPSPPAPVIEPSPVKTKFPTARIKRIMQADEEVGKVSQQTPIAVGKALELFMIQMVRKSAEVAKDKGARKVTANMMKTVVETDDQWDFLRDIVSRIEPEKEPASRSRKPKAESDSDDDSGEPKKKARGRRKKSDAPMEGVETEVKLEADMKAEPGSDDA